jgi:hypothetical protein
VKVVRAKHNVHPGIKAKAEQENDSRRNDLGQLNYLDDNGSSARSRAPSPQSDAGKLSSGRQSLYKSARK